MVVVRGNLENLQSNVDFYLSIVSRNLVSDSDTMRNRFFSMFQSEDKYRKENFLMYEEEISSDYNINFSAVPVLAEGEEIYSSESPELIWGSYEDYENTDNSNSEIEKNNLETEKQYRNNNLSILENEKKNLELKKSLAQSSSSHSEIEKTNSVIKNFYLENEKKDLETEIDDDFISYDDSEIESINLETENNADFSDYNSLENENYYLEDENDIEDEEDEDAYGSWGSEDDEDAEYEDEEEVDEDPWSGWGSDEEDSEEVFEEPIVVSEEVVKSEERGNGWLFEDELPAFEGLFDGVESAVEETITKNKVESISRKDNPEVVEIPKDLREFVKMYPNCEISFALKYFSKKEIDKQLSLSRVFKRKNRLLI